MENVVAINGCEVPTFKGQPVPAVIELLEKYLEDAKAGRLVAVAVGAVIDDCAGSPLLSSGYQFRAGFSSELMVSIRRCQLRIEADLL